MSDQLTAAFAQEMDAKDELGDLRNEFHIPAVDGQRVVYLCGHSLGLQPKRATEYVQIELRDWANLAVDAHFRGRHPWYSYHQPFATPLANLAGAHPCEVVTMNGLTVNLHLMLTSFYRPKRERHAILIDEPTFPSDRYALESQIRLHGYNPDEALLSAEDIEEAIQSRGDEIEVVIVNAVNFLTGRLYDVPKIVQLTREHGCILGLDLAHAIGNVPLRLHDWGVDFAVWCSYKYLNGGPGTVGGCFVHERHAQHTDRPRLAGWWGNDPATRFRMHLEPHFIPKPGADGWQISNPPILAMAPLRASLELFDRAGMNRLREKSEKLTNYLELLLDKLPTGKVTQLTPRNPAQRGCMLALEIHDQPRELMQSLEAKGIVCDFREPNVIRVSPCPLYNTFHDVWTFAQALAEQEPMSDDTPVTIVGSGLAGTLLACMLGKAGRRVELFEKRPDPRIHGQEAGRSINLALSVRGLHALRQVGLADDVVKSSILMRGRMIHARDGSLAFQPYGKDDSEALHSVSRAGLNLKLVEAAAGYPTVSLHFAHRCTGFDANTGDLDFVIDEKAIRVPSEFVIGADGAYSAIRSSMQKNDRFDYSQDYLTHGYKELTIPPATNGGFQMEPNALHIWPRGSFMMIALPNLDGSFTCTLFWPFEGPNSFAALKSEADVLTYFRDQFPDAVPLIPTLAHDFLANPTGSLVTVRCRPWSIGERVVLVGDACHAVVPFLGQGMNAAFEDCTVLGECLARNGSDRRRALVEYEELRKRHVDALADMCIDNFFEMRDKVGSWLFRFRKRVAILLNKLFPRWYVPLYTMIEFTRIPYADARRRARKQDRIVRGVTASFALVLLAFLWWLLIR